MPVKCLYFKEPPNHTNKVKLQVISIDSKVIEYYYHLELALVFGVSYCLKASALNLFNFEPDFCTIN